MNLKQLKAKMIWTADVKSAEVVRHNQEINQLFDFLNRAIAFDMGNRVQIASRGDDRWAICQDSFCWNRQAEWEFERMPSSRSEDFIERTRYGLLEAFEVWKRDQEKINAS